MSATASPPAGRGRQVASCRRRNDLNDFIRGYVSGARDEHQDVRVEQQELFIPGGGSEPPGPGFNSASLGLFRYETPCGTVYGHSGNTFGYTQLAVSSPDGTRSMTVSISLQRTHNSPGHDRRVFYVRQRGRAGRVSASPSPSNPPRAPRA